MPTPKHIGDPKLSNHTLPHKFIYEYLLSPFHCTMCAWIENDVEKLVDPMGEAGSVGFPFQPKIADAVYQQAKGGGD